MERLVGAPPIYRCPSSFLLLTILTLRSLSQALPSFSCSSASKHSSHFQALPRTLIFLKCSQALSLIFMCFHTKHISLEEHHCSSCTVSYQGSAPETRFDCLILEVGRRFLTKPRLQNGRGKIYFKDSVIARLSHPLK